MNKEIIKYDFAKEFSKIPGPRFKRLGDASGEEFRDEILRPYIEDDKIIEIDVEGVEFLFSPSFLSECFGKLAQEYGKKKLYKHIQFKKGLKGDFTKKKMEGYVDLHLS